MKRYGKELMRNFGQLTLLENTSLFLKLGTVKYYFNSNPGRNRFLNMDSQ